VKTFEERQEMKDETSTAQIASMMEATYFSETSVNVSTDCRAL
jgi:hypothetical protein